jgi:hypothetical protein
MSALGALRPEQGDAVLVCLASLSFRASGGRALAVALTEGSRAGKRLLLFVFFCVLSYLCDVPRLRRPSVCLLASATFPRLYLSSLHIVCFLPGQQLHTQVSQSDAIAGHCFVKGVYFGGSSGSRPGSVTEAGDLVLATGLCGDTDDATRRRNGDEEEREKDRLPGRQVGSRRGRRARG